MAVALADLPERFGAYDLHFRTWVDGDVDVMVELFNTQQMDRWTPIPSPFTEEVAKAYVVAAREARRNGTIQFAVCLAESERPLGELLLFQSAHPDAVELAYAVGAARQRQGLGTRTVRAGVELAHAAGAQRALLSIAVDNQGSRATAAASGFTLSAEPLRERRRKGYLLQMETWSRDL